MTQSYGGEEAAAALGGLVFLVFMLFALAVAILGIIAMWKVHVKAGQPGWGVLIPIYNTYVYIKIAGYPGWWLILAFIPIVNLILIVLPFGMAKNFGQSGAFGLGLLLLPIVFHPILAFGSAEYVGPRF